jgi:Zn-dependent protease with chaperone function
VSLTNVLLSLSYAAAATLFLNPRWLARQRPIVWVICTICAFTLACFARNYEEPPAKSLLVHAFGMQLGLLIGFVIGCGLAAIGAVWAWTTFKTFWRERRDPGQVFLLMSLAVLVLAPMKITWQFSSRYIVGALGVLYLIVDAPCQSRRYWAAQMIVGSILGMAILWSYYQHG